MCYLEHMKVGDLVYLVLPCLMEGAHNLLITNLESFKEFLEPELLAKRVPGLFDLICKYSREYWSVSQGSINSNSSKSVAGPKWKYVIHEMRQLENSVARMKVLCQKLMNDGEGKREVDQEDDDVSSGELIRGLMSGRPTVVPGGPENKQWKEILQLFSQNQTDVVSISIVNLKKTKFKFCFQKFQNLNFVFYMK